MKEKISEFILGDMKLVYLTDKSGTVAIQLFPCTKQNLVVPQNIKLESLIQLHIRGDKLAAGFANGSTLSQTESTFHLKYVSQEVERRSNQLIVTTYFTNPRHHIISHVMVYQKDWKALKTRTMISNPTNEPVCLESLSSFSIGGITPFVDKASVGTIKMHRTRSWWSAEGMLESGTLEEYHLEPSWSQCGVRVEKFGQIGSMPVKQYFPFIGIEDCGEKVVWAVQLACPSSWQIEVRRQDEGVSITGGLADYEYGHWMKEILPNESIESPWAYLTVGEGDIHLVAQRLQTIHRTDYANKNQSMPIIFNEFCTTWGDPCEENIKKIVCCLKGKKIDYMVIDAGWYADENGDWGKIGDWNVCEQKFPNGLEDTIHQIQEAGMRPGLWFEWENCALGSKVSEQKDWLLKRNGVTIDTGNRMFLNMNHPSVQAYLREKVIQMLKKYHFQYIKIDYNDSIGIGCDGFESLGEGLRKNIIATQEFFQEIRAQIPGIMMECCSSGGHRLEPSMLSLCDVASFSDAHECIEIPIIAANLHRMMLPAQLQIWAVLRKNDDRKRLLYSLASTFLGVMCLSGDVYDLNVEQWDIIDKAIDLYKKYSHIIRDGETKFYGTKIRSYTRPDGWQAIVRYNEATKETLIVIHTFEGIKSAQVLIPVRASQIQEMLESENMEYCFSQDRLSVKMTEDFDATVIVLKG